MPPGPTSIDGAVKSVPIRGVALAMNEPCGVIGALCPDEAPLLGLVSLMAPAIAMGNACVLVPSEPFPLAATDFYQVLDTSDLPAGVVNIVTGSHAELAKPLAGHMDVDAVWSFSSTDLSGAGGTRVRRQPETDLGQQRPQSRLDGAGQCGTRLPARRNRGEDGLGALRRMTCGRGAGTGSGRYRPRRMARRTHSRNG